jgi:hypothetical protein
MKKHTRNNKKYEETYKKRKENIDEKLKLIEIKREKERKIKRVSENAKWNQEKIKLNADIWGEIFTFLKTEDLLKVKKVCQLFKRAYDKNLWKYNIDLNKWFMELRDEDLKFFKNCSTLNLKSCIFLTNKCLKYIKNVSNLKASFLVDDDLKELKNIKKLDVDISPITEIGLKSLNLDKLEEINLSCCYDDISVDFIESLSKRGINVIYEPNYYKPYGNGYKIYSFDFRSLYPSFM